MLYIPSQLPERPGSYLQTTRERSFFLTFPTNRSNTARIKDDSDNVTRIRYSKTNEVYYMFQTWVRTASGSFVASR